MDELKANISDMITDMVLQALSTGVLCCVQLRMQHAAASFQKFL
jgi:hypothetical protein